MSIIRSKKNSIASRVLRAGISAVFTAFTMVSAFAPLAAVPEAKAFSKSDTIKIMPVGDSITFGQGEDGGYRKYLDYFMKQKGYTGIDLVGPESGGGGWGWGGGGGNTFTYNGQTVEYDGDHAGYSGFQIKQPASWGQDSSLYNKLKEKNAIKTYQPDIVLLIIGTNDMTANRSMSDCANDLRDLVDYMLGDMPAGGKVFMGSIPEFTMYGGNPEKIANYNNTVKSVANEMANAGKNVEFADVHGALDGMNDIGSDNLHPNGKGYEKIGKFWAETLDNYLSSGSSSGQTEQPTQGSDPQQPTQSGGQSSGSADKSRTIKIMPVGDSITFGQGEDGGYRKYLDYFMKQKGYTGIDLVGPESTGGGGGWGWNGGGGTPTFTYNGQTVEYDGDHAGYSGFQIKQPASWGQDSSLYNKLKEKNAIKTYQPDIVLLIIGTNDMTANRSMSDCANDLRDLVDYMLGDMPEGGKVYMGSIPEFTMYGGNPEKIANYNNTVKSVADEMANAGKNVEFADVHGALDGMNDIGSDNLHPNGKGYEKIGKFWADVLDDYLSASSVAPTEAPTDPPTDPPTEPPTEEPVLAGDLDSDGSITTFDLVFFRAGLINGFSSNKMKRAADIDGNGTPEVNDIVLLSKYLLGQTSSL